MTVNSGGGGFHNTARACLSSKSAYKGKGYKCKHFYHAQTLLILQRFWTTKDLESKEWNACKFSRLFTTQTMDGKIILL